MIKAVILLLFIKQGYGAGVTHLEFDTMEQCESFKESVYKAENDLVKYGTIRGYCVKKEWVKNEGS